MTSVPPSSPTAYLTQPAVNARKRKIEPTGHVWTVTQYDVQTNSEDEESYTNLTIQNLEDEKQSREYVRLQKLQLIQTIIHDMTYQVPDSWWEKNFTEHSSMVRKKVRNDPKKLDKVFQVMCPETRLTVEKTTVYSDAKLIGESTYPRTDDTSDSDDEDDDEEDDDEEDEDEEEDEETTTTEGK
jgi:hypothetical protein